MKLEKMTAKMEMSNEKAIDFLIFLLSSIIIGILTALSRVLAFAHDEGTINEAIGQIGYYSFLVFRFPTHNLIWLDPDLIGRWFLPGLFANVLIYATVITKIISKLRNKKK